MKLSLRYVKTINNSLTIFLNFRQWFPGRRLGQLCSLLVCRLLKINTVINYSLSLQLSLTSLKLVNGIGATAESIAK